MDYCIECLEDNAYCYDEKLAHAIKAVIDENEIDEDVLQVVDKVLSEIAKDGFWVFADAAESGDRFMSHISQFTDDENLAEEASCTLCEAVDQLEESEYFGFEKVFNYSELRAVANVSLGNRGAMYYYCYENDIAYVVLDLSHPAEYYYIKVPKKEFDNIYNQWIDNYNGDDGQIIFCIDRFFNKYPCYGCDIA